MAELKITSDLQRGLSARGAAEAASKYPHAGKPQTGPQIDGDPLDLSTLDLSRRWLITPDGKTWTVPDGESAWSDPRTAPVVQLFEKTFLKNVRKNQEGWKGDFRLRGLDGTGAEYDRYLFGLSKDEAARLGPEGVEKAFRTFIEKLRLAAPAKGFAGYRMLEVEPLHDTETGRIHIHVTAHRHAVDVENRYVSPGIVQAVVHEKEAERLIAQIQAEVPSISIDYMNGGGRGFSDEAKEAATEAIREAGGEPTPETAGVKESAAVHVHPESEEVRVRDAFRRVETRMVKRAEEQAADAKLLADIQHALSALEEKPRLLGELATVERERDDLVDQLAATTDTLATTATERDDLAAKLAAEEEAHALTSQHLEQAETRAKRAEGERDQYASRAEKAEADLAGVRDELRERTDELTSAHAELVSERAETTAATTRAEAAEADRDREASRANDAETALAGVRTELEAATTAVTAATTRAETAEADRDRLAKELDEMRRALTAAHAEAEQARGAAREAAARETGLASSLNAIRSALTTAEGALASEKDAHTALKEAAAEAEEADAIPPGGTGLDGVAIDRRRRDPSATWPAGTEYRKGLFGRARITTGDGATLRVQRGAVRLAGGSLTPDAVAAMIVHAQREGWVPIAVSGDERTRAALAEAARAAGLTLEGEEPGLRPAGAAPAAPAQASAAPAATAPAVAQGRQGPGQTFRTKPPERWTKAERDAAGRVFLAAQDRAKEKPEGDRDRRILHVTLEEWGKAAHDHWRKENPEASNDGDADKPKPPKP